MERVDVWYYSNVNLCDTETTEPSSTFLLEGTMLKSDKIASAYSVACQATNFLNAL